MLLIRFLACLLGVLNVISHRPTKFPTQGPLIETESISFPTSVRAGDSVEVYLTVIDHAADSGVSNGFVKLDFIANGWSPCNGEFKLYNGTAAEGTWLAVCKLPDDTMTGDYSLEVHLYDDNGNYAEPQHYDGPITVTDGTDPDTTSPDIEISIESDHLHPGDTLVVLAHVEDAQSGVSKVTFGLYDYYSPTSMCLGDFYLSSGDIFNGTWSYKCSLPSDVPLSVYEGTSKAFDNRGNNGIDTKTVYIEYGGISEYQGDKKRKTG